MKVSRAGRRAWLRARVAQVMLKKNQQLDDYVTEEEDEMLDFMQEGGERYGRFLRELSAPDDEGDEINVHKYGWGDPEGYIAQCWIELEQQHLEDKEAAESLASEINMSRSLYMDEQFSEHSVLGSKTTQFEHNLDEVESAESEPREITEWDVADVCEYEWPHSIGGSQGESSN